MNKLFFLVFIGVFMFNKVGAQTTQEQIQQQVVKLFVFTDDHKWEDLKKVFADKVLLDYSSFSGAEAAELSPNQIVKSWAGFIPKFKATHHQLGNFIIEQNVDKASVFCYGTASHYFPNDSGGNIWTVVGTYDFELIKSGANWKVTSMKFNFKYQDGNTDLPKIIQSDGKEVK